MVFRHRSMALRPVNTLKHVIDSQNTVPAGTQQIVNLAQAVENAVSTTADACDVGSIVNTVFLNVQVVTATNAVGAINNAYMYCMLLPGNSLSNIPLVNQVGISQNRKHVFHQDMTMLSDENDSIPITLFKGVLKIPRKGRRLGVDDRIVVVVGTPVGGPEIDTCIQCIYKEVR